MLFLIPLVKILHIMNFSTARGAHFCDSLSLTLFAVLFNDKSPSPDTLSHHHPRMCLGEKKISTKNSSILGSFADFTRLAKSTPVVLSGFPFLIIGFWQRGGEKKDFYQTLFTGQWIFFTIWMYLWNAWVIHYSRFWSMTMGRRNDWWYLFPDFISLILFIPWPVYLD